jgi:hypothetical protein
MKYEELRGQVQTGDLVAMRGARSLLAKATRWATRSPYTHTAVALRFRRGVWIAQMDGAGNVLVPLSQYADTDFDVFTCPVDREQVRAVVLEQLRLKIRYGWGDIAYLALHRVVGIPLPLQDDEDKVCSSYSATAYLLAGWGQVMPSIAAPADVVAALGGEAAAVLRHRK